MTLFSYFRHLKMQLPKYSLKLCFLNNRSSKFKIVAYQVYKGKKLTNVGPYLND